MSRLKQYINKDNDIIALLEIASFLEDYSEVSEGIGEWSKKLKSILPKIGLHATKGQSSLVQIIGGASNIMAKLLWNALMTSITGNQIYKDKVKEIANTEISKADVIDFLLRLDTLTLHAITGPIHIIDAITGWHIGSNIASGVDDLVDRSKRAIDHLTHIRNMSKDRTIKDKLSSYMKGIGILLGGSI